MGSVIDLYERKDDKFTKISACAISGCKN